MEMKKKLAESLIKIFVIFIIFQMMNMSFVKAGYFDDTIKDANNFIEDGKAELETEDEKQKKYGVTKDDKLEEIINIVYNIMLALGISLAVIIGGILGIQIMWGSIEQQVKAKEVLMPYVIGCIVIFGAFGIWKLCLTIFSQL